MKKTAIVLFLIFFNILFAKNECFLIKTDIGAYTPVYEPNTFIKNKKCAIERQKLYFNYKTAYIGCYKTKKEAQRIYKVLKKSHFNFKNEKIVKMKPSSKMTFIVFPYFSSALKTNLKNKEKKYLKIIKNVDIKKIEHQIPSKFYGNGIEIVKFDKLPFLPISNVYSFNRYYDRHNFKKFILVLYNGVYNIEYLYKFLHNKNIIEKVNTDTYIIKIPVYISPSASLVIDKKTILLEAKPKPVFVMYHGKLYINHSGIFAWDIDKNKIASRKDLSHEEVLMVGKQNPRPYFSAMANSKTVFLNSEFAGLGFHDTVATFGISLVRMPTRYFKRSTLVYWLRKYKPHGILIGNTIHDNMMGFYTNNAQNILIVGNYFYNNIIYDIDPHDYSSDLIIARNIVKSTKFAHGIVVSRGVSNSLIFQNIAYKNRGNGIMLDRSSDKNIVSDNLLIKNNFSGISIQESDDNFIHSNKIHYNKLDGIIIRNSARMGVYDNIITNNGGNAIELLTKNIDNVFYRDFNRDPYHKGTSAVVSQNRIAHNLNFQISVKNNAAIYFYKNSFDKRDLLFGNDLSLFSPKIYDNHLSFKLYGLGSSYHRKSTDLYRVDYTYTDIMKDLFSYNKESGIALANIYQLLNFKKLSNLELQRESSMFVAKGLNIYAFYNIDIFERNKKKIDKFLFYLIEAAILGDKDAVLSLNYIKYILPVNKKDIDSVYKKVLKHMRKGMIFLKNDTNKAICKFPKIKKQYMQHIANLFKYKMKSTKIDSFYEYIKFVNRNYSTMYINLDIYMKKLYQDTNMPKIKYFKYLKYTNQKKLTSKYCKKSVNKKIYTAKQAEKILQDRFEKDVNIKLQMKKYLKLINRYRDRKITMKELLR
jgi:poly(beta-D-mannuronate) C5 epimerase